MRFLFEIAAFLIPPTSRDMTLNATIHRIGSLLIFLVAVLTLSACGSIVDDAKPERELKADIPEIAEADRRGR